MCEIHTSLDLTDRSGFALAEIDVILVLEVDHRLKSYQLDYVKANGYRSRDDGRKAVECLSNDICDFRRQIWKAGEALVKADAFEIDYMQPLWDEWDADRHARYTDYLWDSHV